MNKLTKTLSYIMLPLLITIFSIAYVSLIFNQNIWTDEAFTIQLVSHNSINDIIIGTANDVHPPLYYLIAKSFVSLFGSDIKIYKIVSIIPMILSMLLAFSHIKPWFGRQTAILFVLFLNAIPCVMEYSVQIRMYSWTIFFITLSVLSAYGICRSNSSKHWIFLTISSLCACYTHNFAMISAVFIYILLGLALLLKTRKFPMIWFLSGVSVGICYLPWLFVLLSQTQNRVGNYWIEKITAETVLGYLSDIFSSRLPYTTEMFTFIYVISLILLIIRIKKKNYEALYALCLFAVPVLTALTGIIVSILITPFFIARYLLPCMGLLALAFAIALCQEKNVPYMFLCFFLLSMTANSFYTNYQAEYYNTHTEELLAFMDENLDDHDIILYNNKCYDFIYEYYFDANKLYYLEDMDFNSDYGTIWYFDSCVTPWLPDSALTEHNLKKEYVATYGIEQNDFILYRIYR